MTVSRTQQQKAIRFLAVGGVGFCVDLCVLMLLTHAARAVSLGCSITLTWLLNRQISFGPSTARPFIEYSRYGVVALIAAGVNYSVYVVCLRFASPAVAMILGSAVAVALTFTGYDRWVFSHAKANGKTPQSVGRKQA
jgi:putative flippase GtrA